MSVCVSAVMYHTCVCTHTYTQYYNTLLVYYVVASLLKQCHWEVTLSSDHTMVWTPIAYLQHVYTSTRHYPTVSSSYTVSLENVMLY